MIGQLGGIHSDMQDLVADIRRLTTENEWLKQQLEEAEQNDAERASKEQAERNKALQNIRMLERDLDDAEQQRDLMRSEVQDLEAQLEAEMVLTRQLRQTNGLIHERLSSSPPAVPEPGRAVPPIKLAATDSPTYPHRALSPRQRFGAPGAMIRS